MFGILLNIMGDKKKKQYIEDVIGLAKIKIDILENNLSIFDIAYERTYSKYEAAIIVKYLFVNSLLNSKRKEFNLWLIDIFEIQLIWIKDNRVRVDFFIDAKDIFKQFNINPDNLNLYLFDSPDISKISSSETIEYGDFIIEFYENIPSYKDIFYEKQDRKYVWVAKIENRNKANDNIFLFTLEKTVKGSYITTYYTMNYAKSLGSRKEYLDKNYFITKALEYYKIS